MAKKDADTGAALLEALEAHINALAGGSVPLKGQKSEPEEEETFEWPELTDINSMKLPALKEIGEAVELDLDGKKLGEARTLVSTARAIALDEDVEELDEDNVTALCEALDIEPSKKLAKTLEALKEYFAKEDEPDETEEEEPKSKKKSKVVDAEEDEEEEKPKKKKKGEEEEEEDDKKKSEGSEDDGVDREEVASEVDLDDEDEDDMRERLEAYNEAQEDEDDQIDVPKKGGKPLIEAYRKLVEQLVDSDKKVADWGEPYARDGQAYCCGMPLEEVEVKGIDEDCGQCQVTKKVFKTDDEGDFVEVKTKGKK